MRKSTLALALLVAACGAPTAPDYLCGGEAVCLTEPSPKDTSLALGRTAVIRLQLLQNPQYSLADENALVDVGFRRSNEKTLPKLTIAQWVERKVDSEGYLRYRYTEIRIMVSVEGEAGEVELIVTPTFRPSGEELPSKTVKIKAT